MALQVLPASRACAEGALARGARAPTILVVEDSDSDYALIAAALRKAPFDLVHARSVAAAVDVLMTHDVACVLLDLGLPDALGVEALVVVLEHTDRAILVLTGLDDENLALDAVHRGAQDYLRKKEISGPVLQRAIRYAVERARSQELGRRLNRIYEVIAEVNKAVSRAGDSEALLDAACRIAVQVGGFRMAWAGLLDPPGDRLRVVASVGHVDGYLDNLYISRTSDGPTGRCLRSGEVVVCDDIATDPRMTPWREAGLRRGYRSSAALPFLADGVPIGALSIYAGRPGAFAPDEVRLLERLVADISGAIVLLEARAARRRAEIAGAMAAEQQQRAAEWFTALVQNSSDLIVVVDGEARLRYGSPAALPLLGVDPTDLIGMDVLDLLHPDDRERIGRAYGQTIAVPGVHPAEQVRLRAADGSWRHFEIIANNLLEDPSVAGVVINARDVTERQAAEDRAAGQARVLERIARGSPLAETLEMIALEAERQLPGRRCAVLVADDSGQLELTAAPSLPRKFRERVARMAAQGIATPCGGASAKTQVAVEPDFDHLPIFSGLQQGAGDSRLRSCWSAPIQAYHGGRMLGTLVVYATDPGRPSMDELAVTSWVRNLAAIAIEGVRAEQRLAHQILHDALTGLPNRALFVDRLHQALRRGGPDGTEIAVLYLDLDRFKVINDSLGHSTADELLVAVAARIQGVLRATETVARFGGDEFVVLCEQPVGDSHPMTVAARVHEVLGSPIDIGEHTLTVGASIGIAFGQGPEQDPELLLRDADVAMYRAKERGRGRTELFDEEIASAAVVRLSMETALRRAVEERSLTVVYQPEFDVRTGEMFGVEALVRWDDPVHGSVAPSVFIPIAEEIGLIWDLGRQVLETACRTASGWSGASDVVVSVNLSGWQLSDPRLVQTVRSILADTGLPAELLCLEITESVLMGDAAATNRVLQELADSGVQLAIDDFGTGYSSLAYLRRFPVDFLKIDRSFIDGLGTQSEDRAIVTAVIDLAHSLERLVIAEGVETETQLEELVALGCDFAQGYLWSRPLPSSEIQRLL